MYIVAFQHDVKHQLETKSFETAKHVAVTVHLHSALNNAGVTNIRIQQGHKLWDVAKCWRTGVWEPE